MAHPYQAILLIAFGGPTCREEIRPFLERVTQGMIIPAARIEAVAHHYEAVGGRSPLNEITFRQAKALENVLNDPLPVYVGLRNSSPFFSETLKRMADQGIQRTLGLILSSHRSEASWERYQENLAEARAAVGPRAPQLDYCDGWHEDPLFIQTWTELIEAALTEIGPDQRAATPLIFTAHSLPTAMAARSPYVQQLEVSARLIAARLGHRFWSLAYQSRSGKPTDPWLEPDISQALRDLAANGGERVVVAPIGFVCDHVEVLYDLDIETKQIAVDLGIKLIRASCPNDHPTFIRMMAEIIQRHLKRVEDQG